MMQSDDGDTPARSSGKGYSPREVRHALWYTMVAWLFGSSFFAMTSGAPFTAFLTKYLKANDFTYGLIMAAAPAAMVFLFLGSYAVERTGRIKHRFLIFVSTHRLLWLGVAIIPLWLTETPMGFRLTLVGVIAFVSQALANYGGGAWSTWMADIVPKRIAGKYFGYRAQLGMLSMVVMSTLVVYLLQRAGGVGWLYAVVFGVAAICGATDVFCFIPVREIPRVPEAKLPTLREILVVPWQNSLFRGFAFYNSISWISYMMMGSFVWRFCFDSVKENGLGMSVLQTHILLFILPTLTMAWVAPFWGQAIDRYGPRPVLAASALSAIVAPSVWIFAHGSSVWLLWAAAIVSGLTWPGIDQVNFYMMVKGYPDERRSAYTATFQFVMGLSSMVGTSLGGVFASFWQSHLHDLALVPHWMSHYQIVFLMAITLRLASFVFIFPRLQLPGTAGYGDVARGIATDLTATLPSPKVPRRLTRKRLAAKPKQKPTQKV